MIEVITAPATELITLAEAKLHLRIETGATDEDTYVTSLIKRARAFAEHKSGRSFGTQTLRMYLSAFADEVVLERGPVASIASVTYKDAAGATQTASASLYYLDRTDYEPVLRLVPGQVWPETTERRDAVEITYVAGTWAVAPDAAIQFMLLLIGSMYAHREADAERAATTLPFAERLLDSSWVPRA
jgi:uncharacterized phiE125 gp8 family phage protein